MTTSQLTTTAINTIVLEFTDPDGYAWAQAIA